MLNLLIASALIFLFLSGIFGLFLAKKYVRKISCLSIAYSSFLALIIILSAKNQNIKEVTSIMITILIVFAINLLIGIILAKNISDLSKK